ncbi:MAG: acyl-CoA/acyl-ACP dehydrogenase [Armatimonadetes bacterium]|nr:acyl-CoA/acyl-ACP dehydrogenase [Armatimonadota bacterium]
MSSLDSLLPPETPAPDRAHAEELLQRARMVAEEILVPHAEATDRAPVVPRRNLEALAGTGLLGLSGPAEYGGKAAPGAVSRRVAEILAGACGVTHFVQAQHHGPVGLVASSENEGLKDRYLRAMCEGRILAGVAFSHLRRPEPTLTAAPVPGGYRVSGEAPWVTSWGLAGIFVVAATLPDDRILYFVREGVAADGLEPSSPLELAAMNASSTVRLHFRDLLVPEEDTVRIMEREDWRARDRINTAHPNPAVFGIAETCIRGMRALAEKAATQTLSDTTVTLEREVSRCREAAFGLADRGVTEDDRPRLLCIRAWSLDLVACAAHAYIAAVGGRAMGRDHPAQRLMREAMFYTIQAQTADVREATLDWIGERVRESGPANGG